ncbi:MAG: hypothetical protein Q7J65_08920 [Candidatus Marinimicrobia bacterium]|nr:hypothetical protein [Candidatus Neomarinimicrobiota bacterium]
MAANILTSIIGGGLTGLIGNALTSFTNFRMQKLKNQHEEKMTELDMQTIRLEAEMQVKVTQAETEGKISLADMEALKASYGQAEKPLFDSSYMNKLMESPWTAWLGAILSFLFGVVDFLKHLARPAITYYLMGVSTWITIVAWQTLEKTSGTTPLTTAEAYGLFDKIITIMVYLTVSCVSWWFADRRTAKFLMRLEDGNLKQ